MCSTSVHKTGSTEGFFPVSALSDLFVSEAARPRLCLAPTSSGFALYCHVAQTKHNPDNGGTMKMQLEMRVTLVLLMSVTLVWGQTGQTAGRAADSPAAPTGFAAPTPAALASAANAARVRGPLTPSPVTGLLQLLLANVNSTEAMTNMQAMWATDRYFNFAKFQETAKNVAEMMRRAGLDDVQIGQGPADGVTQAGFWTEPIALGTPTLPRWKLSLPHVPENRAHSCRLPRKFLPRCACGAVLLHPEASRRRLCCRPLTFAIRT